ARLVSRHEPGVVFEQVVQVLGIGGKRLAGIRIGAHVAKRQWVNRIAVVGIEVHILFVSVGDEEIVAHPSTGQGRQFRGIEIERYFIARSEDDKLIVDRFEQRPHISIARVGAGGPRVRASGARLLVNVFHVARRLIFNLQRESVEIQVGAGERYRRQAGALILPRPADEDVVPVDLQIRGDANTARARRKLAGKVGGHGARAAGGESHVIDDANPFCLRVISGRDLGFDIRRKRPQVRLIGSVHASRGEIFDLAMHQQPQWTAAVGLTEIKFQAVGLGKSHEWKHLEVAEIAMREQVGKHVVLVLVPRAGGRTRIILITEHHLERRVGRIAGEIFVGIDVDLPGMIDGQQLHLIEIDRLFERLHEAETELAIFFAERGTIELNGFGRTSDIAFDVSFIRCDPVSDDARTEHVADEFVVRTIPSEERRTRAAAAIHLGKVLHLVGSDFNFILQNAGRPQHADDVGFFRLSKTDGQVGRVLSEVARRSIHFKLLPQASGEDFNFRANSALVIVQPLEREAKRVVLIAAFVAEQHGGAVILRDQKIDGTVVVVVAGNDGARLFELNLVESDVGGDVLPSVGSKITEEADFAFAVFRLADSDEIDPAVVVVVDGGDAVGANPVWRRNVDLLKALAVIIAPQRETWTGAVRKGQVHPTVVIEVKDGNPSCPLGSTLGPQLLDLEHPFARIFEDRRSSWTPG